MGNSRPPTPALAPAGSSCPGGDSVPTENSGWDRVGVTGEMPVARLNGVLADAVQISPDFPVNSGASCGGDSTLPVERGADGFFLRAGRIHGGRAEPTMSSREIV